MSLDSPSFGSGGTEPYAHALRQDEAALYLQDTEPGPQPPTSAMNISRWNDDANEIDLSLLRDSPDPVLDVGCGPARMVQAATGLGLTALGIDVSETAVDIAEEAGLSVLKRSVFDPLPGEGTWGHVLLIDGNIGIGGDPSALLARCTELLAPGGVVTVETHSDPATDRSYHGTLFDIQGHESAPFPWAEIGRDALVARAAECGLELTQDWTAGGRSFCRFVTTR